MANNFPEHAAEERAINRGAAREEYRKLMIQPNHSPTDLVRLQVLREHHLGISAADVEHDLRGRQALIDGPGSPERLAELKKLYPRLFPPAVSR